MFLLGTRNGVQQWVIDWVLEYKVGYFISALRLRFRKHNHNDCLGVAIRDWNRREQQGGFVEAKISDLANGHCVGRWQFDRAGESRCWCHYRGGVEENRRNQPNGSGVWRVHGELVLAVTKI